LLKYLNVFICQKPKTPISASRQTTEKAALILRLIERNKLSRLVFLHCLAQGFRITLAPRSRWLRASRWRCWFDKILQNV